MSPRRSDLSLIWVSDSSPGDIEALISLAAEPIQHLEHQGGFADAGVAPQEDHGPVDHAAAQGAVEFRQAAHLADLGGRLQVDQRLRGAAPGRELHLRHGRGGGHLFGHGTPGAAIGAAAQPFGRLVPTVLTDKHGSSGAGCHGLLPSSRKAGALPAMGFPSRSLGTRNANNERRRCNSRQTAPQCPQLTLLLKKPAQGAKKLRCDKAYDINPA